MLPKQSCRQRDRPCRAKDIGDETRLSLYNYFHVDKSETARRQRSTANKPQLSCLACIDLMLVPELFALSVRMSVHLSVRHAR